MSGNPTHHQLNGATVTPTIDKHGVPWCSELVCIHYEPRDGVGTCQLTGHRPADKARLCIPRVQAMQHTIDKLTTLRQTEHAQQRRER